MKTRRSNRIRKPGAVALMGGRVARVPASRQGPRIPIDIIPCQDCPAGVGEPCLSANGIRVGYHVARRRVATRRYWAEREGQTNG